MENRRTIQRKREGIKLNSDELKNQWHAPFCAAMRLELRENKDILDFINEYNLSSKPLQMDLLVIKKDKNISLQNEIGKMFRGHNIIEYKSPGYSMNVNTYFKIVGYACFYKSLDDKLEEIDPEDITITMIREDCPRDLMSYFKEQKYDISEPYSGIYYVQKKGLFPVQIITSKFLDPELHIWLTSLTREMDEIQAERLLKNMNMIRREAEWNQADAVLDLVMNVNQKIFNKVKEENPMCDALLRLMKPEMDAAIEAAVAETEAETKFNDVESVIRNYGGSLATACETMKISVEDYMKIKEKRNCVNN